MKSFVKTYWTLLFYAFFSTLYLYNNNTDVIFITSIFRPLVVIFFATLVLTFLVDLIIKDRVKVFYLMQIFLIFFFSYGEFQRLGVAIKGSYYILGLFPWLSTAYIILYLLVSAFAFLPKSKLGLISKGINQFILVLFALNLGLFIYGLSIENNNPIKNTYNESLTSVIKEGTTPDIYLIVLDGHGRQDVIKDQYDYDESDFINGLRERGFYVQDNATTNYVQTYLAISSLFNMDFINTKDSNISEYSQDRLYLMDLIANNLLLSTLIKNKYDLIIYNTGWVGSESLKQMIPSKNRKGTITEFEFGILLNSAFPLLFGKDFIPSLHINRTNYAFNDLPIIAKNPEKTFTYTHILIPHPPFVLNKNGDNIYDDNLFVQWDSERKLFLDETSEEYKSAYIEQLVYADKMSLATIDGILANSETPPIIILMSDHGPAKEFTYHDVTDKGIKERFSTLRAVYFPNKDYEDFDQITSHINTFRVVLNKYFNANLPYIPDKKHFTSPWEAPYKFEDVTERYYTN